MKNTLGVKGVRKSVVRFPFRSPVIPTRGHARSLFLETLFLFTPTTVPFHTQRFTDNVNLFSVYNHFKC